MEIKIKNPYSFLRRKEIPFRFDMFSFLKMCELNGIEPDGLADLPENQIHITWLYAAYLSACAHSFRKPRYGYRYIEGVYLWYYRKDYKVLEDVLKLMLSTRIMGKAITEWGGSEDTEKKK